MYIICYIDHRSCRYSLSLYGFSYITLDPVLNRTDALAALVYRIKVAEQDYLADFTSLVAVPIIASFKGVIIPDHDSPMSGIAINVTANSASNSLHIWHLTLRCFFFLVGRYLSSKVLQYLFGHQLYRFKIDKGKEFHFRLLYVYIYT